MKILIAAFFLMGSVTVFAEDVIEQEISTWQKQLSSHVAAISSIDEQLTKLQSQIAPNKKALEDNGCSWVPGELMNCENLAALSSSEQQAVSLALATWGGLDSQVKELQGAREQLVAKAEVLREKVKPAVDARQPAQSIDALAKLLTIQEGETKLQAKWTDLLQDKAELDVTMDELEDHMDQTAIGIYFQDKMGQFVNSTLACKMRRRCMTKERAEVDNKYIEELFPGMSKTRRSSSKYYDKTKSRSGGNQ